MARAHFRKSLALGLLAPLAWLAVSCSPGAPPGSPAEVAAIHAPVLPSEPGDAIWGKAPVYTAALLLQDIVEPRLLQQSTANVQVQAVTDGKGLAFRLQWADPTKDDLPGVTRFSDACAVQLPAQVGADVPAPQMGEMGKGVEITYWRAFWQSTVDGREDTIKALYPGAAVDHYPFEAAPLEKGSEVQREAEKRYAPARALDNPMAGPRQRPVQDLVAEGPGTIRPAAETRSNGRGVHTADGWTVVLQRPLPTGLGLGGRSQVAFAVWEGGRQEAGSRKMRSVWVPLALEGAQTASGK